MSSAPHTIVPRDKLDFNLDGDIPQYWFGGDPFKTRFFDAMSTIFPEGERFFISCVRDFRDQVTDPVLQHEIRDFIRQEGQHGIVHNQFNDRLKAQGIDVDMLERIETRLLFGIMRKYVPKKHTLAVTAASEHMTAIMAHSFFERKEVLEHSDPRMRAMYAWHAMEEIEHKAVAFDVMQKVAKVWYPRRILAMLEVTLGFTIHSLLVTRYMLKVDGFSRGQRARMWTKGLWWLYNPLNGLFTSIAGHYLQYFKPGYHPWKAGQLDSYQIWLDTFNRTGNPILAGEALHAAGH
ncbi:metal-dependent hydrolase [Aquabacterium soli]|uniref:Metal-dependent hydrolase n=1 Tax=Aquabacterium soli TaxID=2493092 RepID=A0A426VDB4_9BURK|nr:metal-dependent hydrolase [Aquabacterium soli]RRS04864.1 metal-dependent hydrolase [Aquabacterium soli]